jgi:hypothetical protein
VVYNLYAFTLHTGDKDCSGIKGVDNIALDILCYPLAWACDDKLDADKACCHIGNSISYYISA